MPITNGLLKELFNIIYATKYRPSFNINNEGYAATDSENVAIKIVNWFLSAAVNHKQRKPEANDSFFNTSQN